MKKTVFAGILAALMVFIAAQSNAEAHKAKFLSPAQVQDAIKFFHKKVLNKPLLRVYLLEIVKAEEDKELMYVYFIPDKSPKSYRNVDGVVNNARAPIKIAIFQYSYLGKTWRVKRVEDYKGDMVFFAF